MTEPRPFSELRPTGLLWLINTTVFHPRGYALALHYENPAGEPTGWSIEGDGTEPWVFLDSDQTPEGMTSIDECFRAVKEVLP